MAENDQSGARREGGVPPEKLPVGDIVKLCVSRGVEFYTADLQTMAQIDSRLGDIGRRNREILDQQVAELAILQYMVVQYIDSPHSFAPVEEISTSSQTRYGPLVNYEVVFHDAPLGSRDKIETVPIGQDAAWTQLTVSASIGPAFEEVSDIIYANGLSVPADRAMSRASSRGRSNTVTLGTLLKYRDPRTLRVVRDRLAAITFVRLGDEDSIRIAGGVYVGPKQHIGEVGNLGLPVDYFLRMQDEVADIHTSAARRLRRQ